MMLHRVKVDELSEGHNGEVHLTGNDHPKEKEGLLDACGQEHSFLVEFDVGDKGNEEEGGDQEGWGDRLDDD